MVVPGLGAKGTGELITAGGGLSPGVTPSGDAPQVGESRWVDTGFGFVEQQIWDGERWFSTGDTHSIPAGTGGGGAGRTIFPSEVERDQAAAALARAQAGVLETPEERAAAAQALVDAATARREAEAEQNALAEEAALKRQRLGTLTDLIQSFMSAQSQARDTLANLQPDPFKFAAVAGGIAPFGTTPQQGFQKQLQQFAGAAVPSFDPSGSAASLEPVIAQLTGAQAPQAPQGFGMASGGTVPTPFNTMSARMVGEKGPEVMITGPSGVTILPLGKGAQEGGFFPFEPIKFDASTMLPALGTSGIFSSFGGIPSAKAGTGGIGANPRLIRFGDNPEVFFIDPITGQARSATSRNLFEQSGFNFRNVERLGAGQREGFEFGPGLTQPFGLQNETFSRLGVAPGTVRFAGDPEVFFRNPGGTLSSFGTRENFQQAGFNFADVTTLGAGQREGYEFGPEFTGRPPIPTEAPSAFTKFSQPIVEPTTGTLLPAPFMVAEQMNRLRLTNPTAFNLLLSAYTSAGVPAEAVLGGMQSSLSFGQERGAIGLR